jgi:uncharacterized protein with GYD domain
MPTFVNLVRFTAEGAKDITKSKGRWERFQQRVSEAGGRVVGGYGLLGEYDLLVITELPDEKAAMKMAIAASSQGTVSTETFTAVPISEFYNLVDQAAGATAARS